MGEEDVYRVLEQVHDPEIRAVNIVDLGMVWDVKASDHVVHVTLIPTFVGCSAQTIIQRVAESRLAAAFPDVRVAVDLNLSGSWHTDRISERGREALKQSGIAPPGKDLGDVACPFCGSRDAAMENLFASTSCRSLYYCRACHNPFEAFKPL
ncbi:phenylacetate-CoA oxygenase subunit PaaJ [Sulfobacillus sp. DSM 109850]|uniref:Phenylacetate-CoA oxygenase subunit PaaJ n=1 Tax=Sulfobacillus harzensis TaxID=2729629 RepID=A0A7Y0L5B7_9FIRM|nr:phenylacetate-CoA oxygenase subunit PaaJ [Sulfobacillus harzensis]